MSRKKVSENVESILRYLFVKKTNKCSKITQQGRRNNLFFFYLNPQRIYHKETLYDFFPGLEPVSESRYKLMDRPTQRNMTQEAIPLCTHGRSAMAVQTKGWDVCAIPVGYSDLVT